MFKLVLENTKSLLKTLAIAVPISVTIVDVFGYVAKVEGYSMQPSLNPDGRVSDFVFLHNWPIAKQSYSEISRGDIVALISPRDPKQRLIKRVIGVEVSTWCTKYFSYFILNRQFLTLSLAIFSLFLLGRHC